MIYIIQPKNLKDADGFNVTYKVLYGSTTRLHAEVKKNGDNFHARIDEEGEVINAYYADGIAYIIKEDSKGTTKGKDKVSQYTLAEWGLDPDDIVAIPEMKR